VTDPCDCRVAMYGSIWADRSVHLASRESGHEPRGFVAPGRNFCNDMDGPERERWMSNVQ
jgi:hypothetical protein